MSAGDLHELTIVRETVPDGMGSEVPGVVLRVWVDTAADGDYIVAATLLLPDGEHAWAHAARDMIDTALRIFELER